MYAYIKGILAETDGCNAVVEASGVGYFIHTTLSTIAKLPEIGKEVKLYTYLSVREDAMELFGFYSKEERSMYELLISVSGVGPKMGIAILSTLAPANFAMAVISNDVKTITKAPGVGPKLAGRIVLELKDKLKKEKAELENIPLVDIGDNSVYSEAVDALAVLGYSGAEAKNAVAGLEGNLEEVIGKALKVLAKRG